MTICGPAAPAIGTPAPDSDLGVDLPTTHGGWELGDGISQSAGPKDLQMCLTEFRSGDRAWAAEGARALSVMLGWDGCARAASATLRALARDGNGWNRPGFWLVPTVRAQRGQVRRHARGDEFRLSIVRTQKSPE